MAQAATGGNVEPVGEMVRRVRKSSDLLIAGIEYRDREVTQNRIGEPLTGCEVSCPKELVDELYETVNVRLKAIKIIALAKSAIRNNLGEEVSQIKQPTLLVWGNNDNITPPFVGKEFHRLMPNSELHFIDLCGHAPMMERPEEFNGILHKFLRKLNEPAAVA